MASEGPPAPTSAALRRDEAFISVGVGAGWVPSSKGAAGECLRMGL